MTQQASQLSDADARTASAQAQVRIVKLEAQVNRQREELDKAERRYLSAVDGRMRFRASFRKARQESKAAREWMAKFATPLINELEGYQNGDPDRAPYVARIAELEAQVIAERARADGAVAELKTRTQDFTRLIEEAQVLMRPQGEWEEEVAAAREALAGMVDQYMTAKEGYVTHEFMSAQEDTIDYLEGIGWLRAGEYERYCWTPASGRAARAARAGEEER
jgi:chromosome segregation ATPase